MRVSTLAATVALSAAALAADAPPLRKFDIPAVAAEKSLKIFSEQSGRGLIVATEILKDVRTNAVQGEMGEREAIERLLEGTGLVASQDAGSGAFAVKRQPSPPREPSNPPRETTKRDPPTADDEPVKLEEFKVTTDIGRYAEVQTSATKTPMKILDVPNTVQVLNAALIADLRAQSLDDLYPYVIGMTRSDTSAAGFTLRGFAEGGVTLDNIEIDGLPGITSRFGSPTTANVERVEVIKGPTSVLYGLMNPGGIMNVVTKRPQATAGYSLTTFIATYAGSESKFGGRSAFGDANSVTTTADVTGPIERNAHWLYRLVASYENLNSFRTNLWFHNYNVFPSLTYRWDHDTELTAQLEVVRQTRFSDSGLAAPFATVSLVAPYGTVYQEDSAKEHDNGATLGFFFNHRFGNNWVLRAATRSVSHTDGKRALESTGVTSVRPVEKSLVTRRYRDQNNRRAYEYFDANIYGSVGPENFRQTLLFGVNAGYEKLDALRTGFGPAVVAVNLYMPVLAPLAYPPDGTGRDDPITRYYNYSAYASDQLALGNFWKASAGLRLQQQDATNYNTVSLASWRTTIHSLNPSVGLVFEPKDFVSFYGSYSSSFLPAIPGNAVDITGRSLFPPEKGNQLEAGIKTDFRQHTLTVMVALYDIYRTNVIAVVPGVFLPTGAQVSAIVGEQESKGAELSATYLPVPNWELQASWTYDDARTIRSPTPALVSARNPNVPRQSANFWTRYNFPAGKLKGVGAGLGAIYVGNRLGTITNDPAIKLEAAAYTRVDAALYYHTHRWNLAANVQNLLDRRYIASVPNAFTINPGSPRKLTLSLRAGF